MAFFLRGQGWPLGVRVSKALCVLLPIFFPLVWLQPLFQLALSQINVVDPRRS
jgi:hypothetical protein